MPTQYIQLMDKDTDQIEYDHIQQAINESVKEFLEQNGEFLNQTGTKLSVLLMSFWPCKVRWKK